MTTSGSNLNTLGKSYEVRGNGADGSHWRDKPLYGWITHLPAGWTFTPAPGTPYMPDGRLDADFLTAFPRWTGGLAGTWSDQVGEGFKAKRRQA
jgi:hypothetical protein